MAPRGNLYVVAAPSGAGKTSLVKALLEKEPDTRVAVSHTTRCRRLSEVNGVNYYFVSEEQFKVLTEQGAFIEFATVFGNLYGTSKAEIEKHLSQGKNVILEIDWQGATQIRQQVPECIGIFILPPSLKTLRTRLQDRALDDQSTIDLRMNNAIAEISHFSEFDFLIVNDDFSKALEDLVNVLKLSPKHLTLTAQRQNLEKLLDELVSN